MAAAHILASDGIIGLIEESVAVADGGVVNGFACWDYIYIQIS